MIYDYGFAAYRTEYAFYAGGTGASAYVKQRLGNYITDFRTSPGQYYIVNDAGVPPNENYRLVNYGDDKVYILQKSVTENICTVAGVNFTFADLSFDTPEFRSAAAGAATGSEFSYNGEVFSVKSGAAHTKVVTRPSPFADVGVSSNYVLDPASGAPAASDPFLYAFLISRGNGDSFSVNGTDYTIDVSNGVTVAKVGDASPSYYATDFVVRSKNGADIFGLDFKQKVKEAVDEMYSSGSTQSEFTAVAKIQIPNYVYDEDGNIIEDQTTYTETIYENARFIIERFNDQFTLRNDQERLLINRYESPSSKHWLGTDTNGMDVLTRMMYGGRISLMIGFVVVIIETIIGVILGGIAGYFGKWLDQFLMRLVDIFNCIPYLPLLIILGAIFVKLQLSAYQRIVWLMAILGFLGWPGVARLVRGQILSLREQDFMLAAEATGISVGRRIFRHLIPNVMPQLIVNATMGLGGVIITESTLSFLGLGAKYPMATWGAMINGVSTAFALQNYIFIWLPIGLFICLTVIAFNFVGDGLRDAFDPKMKR
jgi:ABC-type dipeptide/oligopeptide/nickel transport systems, permease components